MINSVHRMLDLQAGVHLQEEEVLVPVDDELHRPGRAVVDGPGQRHRLGPHGGAGLGGRGKGDGASSITFWCRRWIEHSRSNRCTALPWPSASTWISMCRGSSMNFSTNTRSSPKLDFASDRAEARPCATSLADQAMRMPFAAAAGRGLQHHREADLLRDGLRSSGSAMASGWPGTVETPAFAASFCRFDLVAHGADRVGRRTDEDDAGGVQRLGEAGVLAEEAIARMDRWAPVVPGRPRRSGRSPDSSPPPAPGRLATAVSARLQCHAHVQRVGVRLGKCTATGRMPRAAAGLDDAAGDLAAVGDQQAVEHALAAPDFSSVGFTAPPHGARAIGARPALRGNRLFGPGPAAFEGAGWEGNHGGTETQR